MNLFRGRADQTSRVTGCGRFHELFVSPGNFTLFLFNSWSIVHVYIRRSAEQQSLKQTAGYQ
jgi:hypothetical protein